MSCCQHAIDEHHRAERIERERDEEFQKSLGVIVHLKSRIAELEAALRKISDGEVDSGRTRRPHPDIMQIAKAALS